MIRKVVITVAALFFLSGMRLVAADVAAPPEAIDPGGHAGKVWKVLFTHDGSGVITVSEDKTIRVWDLASGSVRQTFRVPSSLPEEGRMYAAALSPDGKLLAVGGYGISGGLHFIYVISLEKGEIDRVLNGHIDVVDSVAFSPDGKRLLSGSHDKTARIWNLETRETIHTLTGHTDEVYSVAISPDGSQCVTAGFDKLGIVWETETGRKLAELKGHTAEVHCVAWSPDGQTIATGSEDFSIRLWKPTGEERSKLDQLGTRTITSVTFTKDSARLLFTQGYGQGPRTCGLLDLAQGKPAAACKDHTGLALCGALSPDGKLAASAGGDNYETLVWSTADGKVVQKLSAAGRAVWSAAWSPDGKSIAWGHTNSGKSLAADMPLERTFDLTKLEFAGPPDANFKRARLQEIPLELAVVNEATVEFRRGKTDVVRADLEYKGDPDPINCATLLPDHFAALASDSGLYLYDSQSGLKVGQFVGHSGRVRALSPSPDGRYLLSAGEDMTLRVWDAARGVLLMSLLIAGDDWIAWTPEGYYASSAGGERLAGWRIDNGLNKLAGFLPAAQFRKSLYRPEVLRKLLETGNLTRALELSGGAGPTSVGAALPPSVEITLLEKRDGPDGEFMLEAVAVQQGTNPIVSMQVLLNGRPLKGRAGRVEFEKPAAQIRQNFPITLTPGEKSEIVVRADTTISYGVSPSMTVGDKASPGTLYVLAVGVSAYSTDGLRRDGAAADAQAIAQAFEKHSAGAFGKVVTKLVTDQEATRVGILGGLTWLRKQMTPADTGVVYISALGQFDSGNFYILPSDVDTTSLIVSAVPDSQFKTIVPGLPGRVLVLLETSAPSAAGQAVTGGPDDFVRDLAHDDSGAAAIALSTLIPPSGGAPRPFSAAVIEALSGAKTGAAGPDGVLYSTELAAFLRRRLKEQKLSPIVGMPSLVRPFVISQQ